MSLGRRSCPILDQCCHLKKSIPQGMENGEGCSQLGDNFLCIQEGDFTPTVDEHLIPKLGYVFMRDNMIKSIEGFNIIAPEGCSGGAKGSGTRLHGKDLVLSQVSVEEPRQCNTKGRPSGKRLKPMREKLRGKPRKCNCCGLRGQGHDARTCPKRLDSAFNEEEVNSSTEDTSEFGNDYMN